MAPYAFVTLISSDSYLPGALALAGALKDVHLSPAVPPQVDFQTVCLVTPETVQVSTIKCLRDAFDIVIGVEAIVQQDEAGLALLGRPDLDAVLTKLHIFRLTQFSKIIFLDADVLPIRPLSHLFTLPHEFSASPDVGWPDIFNSGMMVLKPGDEKFNELLDLLRSKGTWDGGDQGLLNEWRGNNWNRLSFTYNTTPTAAYTGWDDKVEASSRDGDVEDEGEDSEEEKAADEDAKPAEDKPGPKSMEQVRSRRGSSDPTVRSVVEPPQRRDIGVQTETRELKTQGVQTVSATPQNRNIEAAKKPTLSGRRHWAPASRPNIPPSVTMHDAESAQVESPTSTSPAETRLLSPRPGLRSPNMRSPILSSPPVHSLGASNAQKPAMRVASSPAGSASVISRQASNDSSLASPISSVGPLSPSEGHSISSPRKGGRVWDPARGVELFKRGSEEVLARFLKMGSWEDER
ncbi:hypothetical protein C0992_011597 [Termitomyces sp. T32_za158]|nr:hypothetical protein C0992_011597 [Termitomyces sp. T32_za158]